MNVRAIIRPLAFAVGLFLCFGFGYSWKNLRAGELPPVSALSAMLTGASATDERSADEVFKSAYSHVSSDYYRQVESKQLRYAAMEGMMSSLGDPHTLFLPPESQKAFDQETQGNFVGVGARLERDPLGAKVVTVFEEGPAAKAGMLAGDVITGVDGKTMVGVAVDEIVTHIKGQEGTKVTLTLIRAGQENRKTIVVKRAKITTPTVDGKYFDDTQIGYITVSQFAEPTADQFDTWLDKLSEHPLKGLIIDLRENPGGLLGTAAEMLGRFADDKVVVRMKMRDGHEEFAKTPAGHVYGIKAPIVILINENSASASEIFAGVMHDYNLATLVGEHSYGKMSVQNIFHLRDMSGAKITIARYYLPGGELIERKVNDDGKFISGGLRPDVESKLDPDDIGIVYGKPDSDTQLQKAIEVIKSKE